MQTKNINLYDINLYLYEVSYEIRKIIIIHMYIAKYRNIKQKLFIKYVTLLLQSIYVFRNVILHIT